MKRPKQIGSSLPAMFQTPPMHHPVAISTRVAQSQSQAALPIDHHLRTINPITKFLAT
jgi:hypothetical protein